MSLFRRKLLESYATNKLVYPGLIAAWSAKGKTNEDADRNILKDLTGNGHDITLNNFAYGGMSGYGGYNWDFRQVSTSGHPTKRFINITENTGYGRHILTYGKEGKTKPNPSFKIKVTIQSEYNFVFNYNYFENGIYKKFPIDKSGIYICPASEADPNLTSYFPTFDYKAYPAQLTIELLPEYPDALVFDGVDDYGVNESLPSLTDYTVISKIYWITSPNASVYAYGKAKDGGPIGSIIFSSYSSIGRDVCYLYNFGIENNVKPYVNPTINYHNTKVFNGIPINKGYAVDGNYPFCLGRIWATHNGLCNMAFYSFYLFNRTLTDEEIKSFIRKHIDPEYLLPSEQIPTPDVYYDFTNGDNSKGEANNVITDLSGNGNDAVAHNFAWNEESGYAEGRLKFDGVDDYISLDTFDSVFKTMFMVCTNFEAHAGSILYDQRSELFNKNYSVAYYPSSIAYNNDNINGTYINGTLNTKLACQELNNKKHLIHVVAKDTSESRKPNIGRSLGQNQYSNMMLYKFLGFKEALTEEQIKAVINKYNLLDGVDNIDVN